MQEKSYTNTAQEKRPVEATIYEPSSNQSIWLYLEEKNHKQISKNIDALEIQSNLVLESMTVSESQEEIAREKTRNIEKEVQNKLHNVISTAEETSEHKVVWSYYMTKNNWQNFGELSADNLELIGESEVINQHLLPKQTQAIAFPSDRKGKHLIVAMSDDIEVKKGFYHVIEIML